MIEVLNDIRFSNEDRKVNGIHFTPPNLSKFVAQKIFAHGNHLIKSSKIRIFDPATGDGELLKALSEELINNGIEDFEIHGFDTNPSAINASVKRLSPFFNNQIDLSCQDFLEHILNQYGIEENLFNKHESTIKFDFIISNPPYVRTQHLGAEKAQEIARNFSLKGRVDLYQPFIIGISRILKDGGVAGIIVSNRFLTTRSGAALRKRILEEFEILHVWDMGDTKFFNAAVLPAVILLRKKIKNTENKARPKFSSIYLSQDHLPAKKSCNTLFEALEFEGIIELENKQRFYVRHGNLDVEGCHKQEGVWRLSDNTSRKWITRVEENTYCKFGDIGKIRVGVKTTADKVFIRTDWEEVCGLRLPELLRPLTTHHIARRYKPFSHDKTRILYTHENIGGIRRPIDINKYSNALRYLLKFKTELSSRQYIKDAGREWFEIWVPHDPKIWDRPKIIFRDISEKPTFWMDIDKTVVNGDCYWFTNEKFESADMLWLAMAIANSTFIEFYYDQMFNNKLYSNRRRFMTQYVEKFPVSNPDSQLSRKIVSLAQEAFSGKDCSRIQNISEKIDELIWKVFGLNREEVCR